MIIGGDSQIGKALANRLAIDGRDVLATTRKWPPTPGLLPFDLRHDTWLPRAAVTYFCTGINGFKPCEADPDEARRINVTLLCRAADRVAKNLGGLVYLSSSAAETHPDTVYGRCKREAETHFLQLGAACYRFGPVAFPGRNVYPNDTYSPINLSTLTDMLARVFDHWEPGLHRITNRQWKPEEAAA